MDRVFIIAEAGVNHNGNIDIAKKMIDVAKEIGADAIKFQTFKAENIVIKIASKSDYQRKNTDINETQLDMLKRYELDFSNYRELKNYCQMKNIEFLSSPFDLESIDLLNDLGLNTFKIPSGEINNLPYLRKIGYLRKKVLLSTGMCDIDEISDALDILIRAGTLKDDITVLHCHTQYPTLPKDVNLKAMLTIEERFKVKVGYSDHTLGIEIALAAVSLGAKVIEKHFTLDRSMEGPDHKASLQPDEFKEMVRAIRNIELSLGDGVRKPSQEELKNRVFVRKSIVAGKDIKKGEVFNENNLAVKRPALGLNPMLWDKVIGKKAKRDFKKDEFIEL
ncbi:MAG: N-acetylneuraminate synthase [Candidatus Omnitrophica bacterium]|nr:N-acetylneuraminate synthase [Candidatus Omnitrophota bacterium]MCM8826687.1 N-acetylneuraminate synthase [Candidatus Omnitrophota bacterium]